MIVMEPNTWSPHPDLRRGPETQEGACTPGGSPPSVTHAASDTVDPTAEVADLLAQADDRFTQAEEGLQTTATWGRTEPHPAGPGPSSRPFPSDLSATTTTTTVPPGEA
jgi:hypothetical protein